MSDKEKLTKLIEELVGEDGEGRYTFLEILQKDIYTELDSLN